MTIEAEQIRSLVQSKREAACSLFAALAAASPGNPGITRAPYGERENAAQSIIVDYARGLGLEIGYDAAANAYMTLPGKDRNAPRVIIGSHLDSVKQGGNFDGAAGVVCGLLTLEAMKELGITPSCDVSTMAIRAEESVWFEVSYLGSRGALGTLPEGAMDARRTDTQRTAREHIADCGGDPDALERGEAYICKDNVRCFLELHIEQAPSLEEQNLPVGICTGVPGLFMYPNARVVGEYGHVGTPMRYRHDAVVAASDFLMTLDRLWEEQESRGNQMAVTFGRFHTDSALHGMTSIAGEFRFSLDVRAYEDDVLAELQNEVLASIKMIEERRRVRFELGEIKTASVGYVSKPMMASLVESAELLDIPFAQMNSPASHDAGAFSAAGIPTGMVFVRNQNGSHNPHEEMHIDDFLAGTSIVSQWLVREVAGI